MRQDKIDASFQDLSHLYANTYGLDAEPLAMRAEKCLSASDVIFVVPYGMRHGG